MSAGPESEAEYARHEAAAAVLRAHNDAERSGYLVGFQAVLGDVGELSMVPLGPVRGSYQEARDLDAVPSGRLCRVVKIEEWGLINPAVRY
jgi:hypothetical protein